MFGVSLKQRWQICEKELVCLLLFGGGSLRSVFKLRPLHFSPKWQFNLANWISALIGLGFALSVVHGFNEAIIAFNKSRGCGWNKNAIQFFCSSHRGEINVLCFILFVSTKKQPCHNEFIVGMINVNVFLTVNFLFGTHVYRTKAAKRFCAIKEHLHA